MKTFYKKVFVFLMICTLVVGSFSLKAQSGLSKSQALYTLRFLKYINWEKSPQQYRIGVVGSNSQILLELAKSAKGRLVNGKPVRVEKVISYASLSSYSVIFIPKSQSNKFNRIKSLLKGKEVLIITEASHLTKYGADISFYVTNSRLKFNLNKANIYARKLTVSSRLLSVATVL